MAENVFQQKLFTPGPVELNKETLEQNGRQMISHRGAEFHDLLAELHQGIQQIFETSQPAYCITGSGTLGVEFMVSNAILRTDKVACLTNGTFGNRLADIAAHYSDNCQIFPSQPGNPLHYEPFDADVVVMTQNETSTGVLNNVRQVRKDFPEAVLLVDAVSAVGHRLEFDDCGADGIATATQKALAAPPGLAFACLSQRATQRAKNARPPYYLELAKYAKALEKNETPFTPAVSTMFAAAHRTREILLEGLFQFVQRHDDNANYVRKRLKKTGLPLLAKNGASPSNTITAIEHPASNSIKDRLKQDGFTLAGGQDALKGKIVRLAHMGNTTLDGLARVLDAIEQVAGEINTDKLVALAAR